MKLIKRLNNNVVLAKKEGKNVILTGKGIGFQKVPGDNIEVALIERTFIAQDQLNIEQLAALVNQIPMSVIVLTNEIITLARAQLEGQLNPNLLIPLSDHLWFALERTAKGMEINNPLEWEIKQLYPLEYRIAEQAVVLINQTLNSSVPPGEASFIALHFVNGQLNSANINQTMEMTVLMSDILLLIERFFAIKLNQQSVTFHRFIVHLRYYFMRALEEQQLSENDLNLANIINQQCEKEFQCAQQIAHYLQQVKQIKISAHEQMYLTLHINRLLNYVDK